MALTSRLVGAWSETSCRPCCSSAVHGFDTANALDFADGERSAAFAHGANVAARRRVERDKLQTVLLERGGNRLDFRFHRVFEMAARAENFDALESSLRNLSEQFRRQLPGHKEIS